MSFRDVWTDADQLLARVARIERHLHLAPEGKPKSYADFAQRLQLVADEQLDQPWTLSRRYAIQSALREAAAAIEDLERRRKERDCA